MVKFYFFENKRVASQQGNSQMIKLFPLPGQETYRNAGSAHDPVHPDWAVQVPAAHRSLITGSPIGTVFYVRIEGNTLRDTKLLQHSRGGVDFYRTEASVVLLRHPNGSFAGDASQEAVDAYNRLIAEFLPGMTPDETTAASAPVTAPAQEENDRTDISILYGGASGQRRLFHAISIPDRELARRLNNLSHGPLHSIAARLSERTHRSNASRCLYQISRIRDLMTLGVAEFWYRKNNGDLRHAYGTLNPAYMPELPAEEQELRDNFNRQAEVEGNTFPYFDMEKQAWRCFCVENIQEFTPIAYAQATPV